MSRTLQAAALASVVVASAYCDLAAADSFNRPQDVRQITDLETYLAGLTDVDKFIENL